MPVAWPARPEMRNLPVLAKYACARSQGPELLPDGEYSSTSTTDPRGCEGTPQSMNSSSGGEQSADADPGMRTRDWASATTTRKIADGDDAKLPPEKRTLVPEPDAPEAGATLDTNGRPGCNTALSSTRKLNCGEASDRDPLLAPLNAEDAAKLSRALSNRGSCRAQMPNAQRPLRQSLATVHARSRGQGGHLPPQSPGAQANAGWHTPPEQRPEAQSLAAAHRENAAHSRSLPHPPPQSTSASRSRCHTPS